MAESLSPRQVASALQVSESSVKRWCDQGLIGTHYTAGGHRRIATTDVVKYLRHSGKVLPRPEVIGLRPSRSDESSGAAAVNTLVDALVSNNDRNVATIVIGEAVHHRELAHMFDTLVAPAFRQIGHEWDCGTVQVFQERRSCEICLEVLSRLKEVLPTPAADAVTAVCATPDNYAIPVSMVELVLQECGYRAVKLGTELPLEAVASAVEKHQPSLCCLSFSHIDDPAEFLKAYEAFYARVSKCTAVVVGGQALDASILQEMSFLAHCANLRELHLLAEGLLRTAV